MAHQREEKEIEIDPEYVTNNRAVWKAEEKEKEGNKLNSEKLSKIVSEIFDKELAAKEKLLEEIEDKVTKAQKLLHLVRYALITSYYNKKTLEVKTNEESITKGFDSQNRLHPALKKLLGNNSGSDVFTSGRRRVATKNCDTSDPVVLPDPKKIKLEKPETSGTHSLDNNLNCSSRRKKKQHRLIVGNVSKYIAAPDDNTTHKWMMYVRGDKDHPEISHIVKKVVFYLHPSYRPHDVIEVCESPFHLSRRGWGEFPLRVQIHFKCPLNKPISIVHNLKLDKTYTGRQTLGNETIVDVFLHESQQQKPHTISRPPDSPTNPEPPNNSSGLGEGSGGLPLMPLTKNVFDNLTLSNGIKIEDDPDVFNFDQSLTEQGTLESIQSPELNSNVSFPDSGIATSESMITNSEFLPTVSDNACAPSDTASLSFEHDYCQDNDVMEEIFTNIKTEAQEIDFLEHLQFEHSCSLPHDLENSCSDNHSKSESVNRIEPLMNGHSDNGLETIPNSKYKVTLPENKFKSVGEVMPYLVRRLPLWHELAHNEEFKIAYPFIATSKQEFDSWNIGKRLNSEWNRARELRKILSESFPTRKKWNTKACFMYARSHGYYFSVRSLGNFFKRDSEELRLINSCFKEASQNTIANVSSLNKIDVNINVDIISEDEKDRAPQNEVVDISDPALKHQCSFVKETALDCGIILKPEALIDGVTVNGAERMILEAVKCFAESLIRRANHHTLCENKGTSDNFKCDITKRGIEMALKERPEYQVIRDFQLKKREKDFFS